MKDLIHHHDDVDCCLYSCWWLEKHWRLYTLNTHKMAFFKLIISVQKTIQKHLPLWLFCFYCMNFFVRSFFLVYVCVHRVCTQIFIYIINIYQARASSREKAFSNAAVPLLIYSFVSGANIDFCRAQHGMPHITFFGLHLHQNVFQLPKKVPLLH